MRSATRIAAACALAAACAPTPATLEVPLDGTLLLAMTDESEALASIRRIEAPALLGRDPTQHYWLGAYAAAPEPLGLVGVDAGGERALPWPDAWFVLSEDRGRWIEREDPAPPAWARTFTLARAAAAPCERWRARPATLPTTQPAGARVAAAARWSDAEVVIAWSDTTTITVVGRDGPRGALVLPRLTFTRTQLASVRDGEAYYLANSALYVLRGEPGALTATLVRNDTQSVRAGHGRLMALTDGQGGASLSTLTDPSAAPLPIADLDSRPPVDAWPVPDGTVIAFRGTRALQRVGLDGRADPPIAAPGGNDISGVAWVTSALGEAWALATSGDDTLVLAHARGRWAWRARLSQASRPRIMEPDGDGVWVASASGLSAYAPAAGECALDAGLREADVLVRVSDARWFAAGLAPDGTPAAVWLEAP